MIPQDVEKKTQKLQLYINSNCDNTKKLKLWQNLRTKNFTKLIKSKFLQNLTQILIKLIKKKPQIVREKNQKLKGAGACVK